jgi:hypothetical protein
MINKPCQPEQRTNMNIPLLFGPYGSAALVGSRSSLRQALLLSSGA